ncbi:methyltransferase, TIGR04325 family [Pectinatus frisingensis]|uniref:methyltransferase, TIGR04325 family n=1 Tax=Pectinatus frisingensis TaxID=865 RepID=UPI0018C4A9BA|nr:methyltransferase, TIGR04325 family [Pectinatus frisingensis]
MTNSYYCLFRKMLEGRLLYLFGAGEMCRDFLRQYSELNISGIFDNYKAGEILQDKKILSANIISTLNVENSVFLVTTSKNFLSVLHQLEKSNIKYIFDVRKILGDNVENYLVTYFKGIYSDWSSALSTIKRYNYGYDADKILHKVANAIQKVRQGKAIFERDSVLFYNEDYNFNLLAAFFYILTHEGLLQVIDFGGSLGSTYFQNRNLFNGLKVEWNVIEQAHFVDYGQKFVPEIHFFHFNDEIPQGANTCLMSSVLQYLDQPYEYLGWIIRLGKKYIVIDRMPFSPIDEDQIVMQKIKPPIYDAEYPVWLLAKSKFMDIILKDYHVVFQWTLTEEMPIVKMGRIERKLSYHGILLKKLRE